MKRILNKTYCALSTAFFLPILYVFIIFIMMPILFIGFVLMSYLQEEHMGLGALREVTNNLRG